MADPFGFSAEIGEAEIGDAEIGALGAGAAADIFRDFSAPVDAQGSIARHFGAPVEWDSQNIFRDFTTPVEFYTNHNRKFRAPVEWGGQPADSLLVVWDVQAPLNALLLVTWTVLNFGLVAQLPVIWTVFSVAQPLTVIWTVQSPAWPGSPGAPAGTVWGNDIQKPFGEVIETPTP